jgi:hypothetical protein
MNDFLKSRMPILAMLCMSGAVMAQTPELNAPADSKAVPRNNQGLHMLLNARRTPAPPSDAELAKMTPAQREALRRQEIMDDLCRKSFTGKCEFQRTPDKREKKLP